MGDDLRRFFESLAHAYEPERLLGSGGMAVVWLARDLRHQRRVALKLLKPELLVGNGHDRFLREIGFLAELSHPNILPLIDSGEARDEAHDLAVPFFTMPYLTGESLREHLITAGRMPLEETLHITRDVAAALDHAHAAGVVHRDIKPGNILLAGGRAVVADFGIARAVDAARGTEALTETGARIGTPHYLAPEENAGPPSDQYALACVVHEMLVGTPPFPSHTPATVMARHLFEPPPSMRAEGVDCPPGVDAAVQQALAKDPAARFASAGEFARTLERAARGADERTTPIPPAAAPRPARAGRLALMGLGAVALAVAAWALIGEGTARRVAAGLDTTRFVILPDPVSAERRVDEEQLRDALQRWDGVTVVDPFQVREMLADTRSGTAMTPGLAARVASRLGAGRYLVHEVTVSRDSARLRVRLYRTADNGLAGERQVAVALGDGFTAAAMGQLADSLLLGRLSAPPSGTRLAGSTSLAALQAFARGSEAIGRWDLMGAAAAFGEAVRHDQAYPQAALWLALVRSWLAEPVASWQPLALRAEVAGDRLADRDRQVVAALRARSEGDMGAACRRWRDLSERFPGDFVTQYGLADCLVQDHAVERDPSSRSGWRFRSSLNEASAASVRAFALLPSIYRSLDPDAPGAVHEVYRARYAARRPGQAVAPDTGTFMAQATLEGDTLAYVPYPLQAVRGGDPATVPPPASAEAAERRLHRRHYEAILAWLDGSHDRAAPLAAFAEALERLGDRSALDTLRVARNLTKDPDAAYRLAVAEVFLQLRASVPDDVPGVRRARALADSLLAARRSPRDLPYERAALAALTGRALLAAQLCRQPELTVKLEVPPYLVGEAPALVVFAALGGPVDSIAALEGRVDAAIRREFADPDRLNDRMRWLSLAASLAWPRYAARSLALLRGRGDPVLDAVAAAAAHDSAGVLRALEPYTAYRRSAGQLDLTLDALPAESELRWDAGDRAGAVGLLDASLGTLYGDGFTSLESPQQAAGLVRAAALRARVAAESGDTTLARRWRTVVEVLWSDADAALAPVVRGAVASVGATNREGT